MRLEALAKTLSFFLEHDMDSTRRVFLMTSAAAVSGMALAPAARAQVNLDEKDPQAAALGYVTDAARADVKKYPRYAAGQVCGQCLLYKGAAGAPAGMCQLFAGKQVSAKGWCSAWAKKA